MGQSKLIMDIGSKFTKFGVVTKTKTGYHISKATYVYTPADYNFRDKMWLEQVKHKVADMKVRGKPLYVLLSRDNINVMVEEDTIQKAKNITTKNLLMGINNKIANTIQDKDTTVSDWNIVRQDDSAVTFLYTVIKRDVVDMLAVVAEQCKLKLVSIGVRSNALLGVVNILKKRGMLAEQGEDEVNCVAYLGQRGFILACLDNEGVFATKAESNDLSTLDSDLLMAQSMGEVQEQGFKTNEAGEIIFEEQVAETVETKLTEQQQLALRFDSIAAAKYTDYKRRLSAGLVSKLSRQLDKITYKGKRVGVKNMYLVGSSAKLPHVDEYIKEQIGAENVVAVDVGKLITFDAKKTVPNVLTMPLLPEMFTLMAGEYEGGVK